MDETSSVLPAISRNINIAGRNVNATNVELEDAAAVVANFRKLVLALFPNETNGVLKLKDVGDYRMSFFNLPGDDRTHIIFQDDLLKESIIQQQELEAYKTSLRQAREKIETQEAKLTKMASALDEEKIELQTIKSSIEERRAAMFQTDSSGSGHKIATASDEEIVKFINEDTAFEKRNRAFKQKQQEFNNIRRAFKSQKASFERKMLQYQGNRAIYQPIAYDTLQLENGEARYGTNKLVTSSESAASIEAATTNELLIFTPLDEKRSGENARDLQDAEIKKRVFNALFDLERLAQELLHDPQNSTIGKAVALELAGEGLGVNWPKLKEVTTKISLFVNPETFDEQVKRIDATRQSLEQAEEAAAVEILATKPATATLAPIAPRPLTAGGARFSGTPALPSISPARKEEDEGESFGSDEAAPADRPPTPPKAQPAEIDEADGYEPDFYEPEADEEAAPDQDLAKAAKAEVKEILEALTTEMDPTDLSALGDALGITAEELPVALTGFTILPTTKPDSNTNQKASGAEYTDAVKEYARREMERLTQKVIRAAKKQGQEMARAAAAKEDAANKQQSNTITAQDLTPEYIRNFAKYIYKTFLEEKRSGKKSSGYFVINRGTSTAAHENDVLIFLPQPTSALILHCTSDSIAILEINQQKKSIQKVTSKKSLDSDRDKFFDFINQVCNKRFLNNLQRDEILTSGELKKERSLPMPPTAAKKLPTPPKTPALAAAAAYNGPRKLTASATTSKTSNVTAAGSEKQKPAQARKESGKADSLTKKQEGETTTVKDSTPKLPAATKKPQPPVTRHEPRPPAAARRIATAFGSSFAAKQPNKKPKGSITRGGSEALTSSTTTPKQVSK